MISKYSESLKRRFPAKQEFVDRMRLLLGDEVDDFMKICYTETPDSIRCNTLKISPEKLKVRLEKYGWKINQPYMEYPEIMIVEKNGPGELGKSKEHLLGYFYVQEISSMLPILVLQPNSDDTLLDLCASPGSKTTQAAASMKNCGNIIANEVNMGRIGILSSNLERCGVTNVVVTRKDGVSLCNNLIKKTKIKFSKILVDAPCTGEGTLRKSPKTFIMWNKKMIDKTSSLQKRLAESAMRLLEVGGEMVYSTCTIAPEENEFVIDHLIKNFDIEIESIHLPIKFRSGVVEWDGKKLNDSVSKCLRLYPQDNNTDGFFVCKMKKLSDKCLLEDRK